MKEIEFRVWDKKEKRMLIGGADDELVSFDMEGLIYYKGEFRPEYQKRFVILFWTGQKDKNNKKIFEGNIIKCKSPHAEEIIAEIKWDKYYWAIENKTWCAYFTNCSDIEVIGNIYENSELLEEEK